MDCFLCKPIVLQKLQENFMANLCLLISRCASKMIKTNVEPVVYILVNGMISIYKQTNQTLILRNNKLLQIIVRKSLNLTNLSQISLGEQFSSIALVSVAVPYSSVPHIYIALYPLNRQYLAYTSALKTP